VSPAQRTPHPKAARLATITAPASQRGPCNRLRITAASASTREISHAKRRYSADREEDRSRSTAPGRRRADGTPARTAAAARDAVQTVAIGDTGEPTAPGRRRGGAVSRKRLRLCSRSQCASAWRYQISPSGTPSL